VREEFPHVLLSQPPRLFSRKIAFFCQKPAFFTHYDTGDPEIRFDNAAYLLEPGNAGGA
jgi:hypothetical protein